jgi:hypothetical protein
MPICMPAASYSPWMAAEQSHGRHVADIVRVVMGKKLCGVICVESEGACVPTRAPKAIPDRERVGEVVRQPVCQRKPLWR